MDYKQLLALMTTIIVSHDSAPDVSTSLDLAEEIFRAVLDREKVRKPGKISRSVRRNQKIGARKLGSSILR